MTRSRARRGPDGVLLFDKPAGVTSHAALRRAMRLLQADKGGHTGTLDPLATGLLPLCFGEATKFSHLLLEASKTYLATIRLGMKTRTGDLEGEVIEQRPVAVEAGQVPAVLRRFEGEIEQVPPMYSAIKHEGRRLYQLARAGIPVERLPRRVQIERIELLGYAEGHLTVRVTCSKGTYIRVLAEDIGDALGCGACLAALRREAVGAFSLASGAVTLDDLERLSPEERRARLLPADALAGALPWLELDESGTQRLTQGQSIELRRAGIAGLARVYGPGRRFLGVAEVSETGRIVPRRLTARET